MALRRNVTISEWVDITNIGRVLVRPKTGRLQAEFEKRIGLTPHGLRRERVGTRPDGSDEYADFVQFSADPMQAYEARVWLVEKLTEEVDAHWDDGAAIERSSAFFEAVADDDDAFNSLTEAADNLGKHGAEVTEKN